MEKLLNGLIHDLTVLYTGLRGEYPKTLHCHPATANLLTHELLPDPPDIQRMHLIQYQGMRLVVDYKITPGTIYVDGD